jgi:acyl carrier protein
MNDILSDKDLKVVQAIIIEQLEVQESQVTPEARLKEDLGADSLDIVEIVMLVEERFNITVADDVAEAVSTAGDLCEALAELLYKPQRERA